MKVFVVDSDRWQGEIPAYLPRFCDGWRPPAFWLEEIGVPASVSALPHQPAARFWKNGTTHDMVLYFCSVLVGFRRN